MKSYSNIGEILDFLEELRQNNDRVWFKERKDRYDALRKPWERDIERLIALVGEFDDNVRGLQVKDSVYRIYRDIRFSHDKSPYKTYFSAVLARGGRHTVQPGYYLHFEPGKLMLCGGIWWPAKEILAQLRSLIDAEPEEFTKIVSNPELTARYTWESDSLKKMPADYPKDHALAQFIKMKEYIMTMHVGPDYYDCDDWVERVAGDLRPLKPLHDFLAYVFD